MKTREMLLSALMILVGIGAWGCGDDDGGGSAADADTDADSDADTDADSDADTDTDTDETVCGGHGVLAGDHCVCDLGWAVDPDDATNCIVYEHEQGVPYLLIVYMHDPPATKIYIPTMSVIGDPQADDYDLHVSHLSGPTFELGPDVTAINLGNGDGFDDVAEVPEDGYEPDGAGVENMIIGISYRTGGTGSTGYIMSENIYALRIDDGADGVTYAKMEVLEAKAGVVRVLFYWQPDGSRDVQTGS